MATRHWMFSLMLAIDMRVAQRRQLPCDGAAERHRHDLIFGAVNDVDGRVSKICQKGHQHVVEPARHGSEARKKRRMVHADQPGANAAVRHTREKDAVRIDMVALPHISNCREHQVFGTAREPGSCRIGRTRQDVVLSKARLPAFEIHVACKSRAVQADDQRISP